jgi:hypothetical protein
MKLKVGTLYSLLFGAFVLGIAVLVTASILLMELGERYLGFSGRVIVAAFALLVFFFVLMRQCFRAADKLDYRSRAEAKEKYCGIYRVLALPAPDADRNNWQTSEITVGDFGWESTPLSKDGLIWLHGLSADWGLVWRAGFRPDQIEYVGPKPVSQFDWKDFEYDGPKPAACYHWPLVKPKIPCPFPIQKPVSDRRLQFPTTSV